MNRSRHNRLRLLVLSSDPAVSEQIQQAGADQFEISLETRCGDSTANYRLPPADIVVLDAAAGEAGELAACREICERGQSRRCQLLLLTEADREVDLESIHDSGADDVLTKPLSTVDLRFRLRLHANLLASRAATAAYASELRQHDSIVSEILENRRQEHEATQQAAVFLLTKFAEARDAETAAHLVRMSHYSMLLAGALVDHDDPRYCITQEESLMIGRMSILHDIGKVSIPDRVLLKPGRLDEEEFRTAQQHTTIGAEILREAMALFPSSRFLRCGAVIAKHHHERWDGGGYPSGLAGHEIPLAARVVAVADVFDAITMERPHRPAKSITEARKVVEAGRGTHFDPELVDIFQEHFADFRRIHRRFSNDRQRSPAAAVEFPTRLFGTGDDQPFRLQPRQEQLLATS